MDTFHPDMVFSSIDEGGRYAWSNQPTIAQWNLSQLAQTLVPLFDQDEKKAIDEAIEAIGRFSDQFSQAYLEGFSQKLGFQVAEKGDGAFIEKTLSLLAKQKIDFTLFFRHLTSTARSGNSSTVRALFAEPDAFEGWFADWQKRLFMEKNDSGDRQLAMMAVNPVYIPRNHRVEEMIQAALGGDFDPFERLLSVLSNPYGEQLENAAYEAPPTSEEVVHWTYCGT